MKKKEAMAMNAAGGDESMKSAPVPTAFPLSTDLRLFPVLPEQKAKPIKYEPFRLQFCHYREEEKRHKCPVEGCNKRYKNLQGVRAHTRQAHGSTDEAVACGAVPFDLTAGVSGQALATVAQSSSSGRSANVRPYKCNQCPKRYKTIAGLNNHIQQGHQRINPKANSLKPIQRKIDFMAFL
ncbi:unnamed protein product [Gongylonema pulchrum]|uniref:C2H2-type domain-containing protein n=1 Tax=Gongylonema pulchrum TaxID=637853 RepID=A0A183EC52_9BILA|nr:unnamed protein product [Gongylonema pulchrum]